METFFVAAFSVPNATIQELTVSSQPNPDRDCIERFPEAVLAYLKKASELMLGCRKRTQSLSPETQTMPESFGLSPESAAAQWSVKSLSSTCRLLAPPIPT